MTAICHILILQVRRFVCSGNNLIPTRERILPLNAGTLLLVERGEAHEIRNAGEGPLRTLNVYVPPAYTEDGDELPRGRK